MAQWLNWGDGSDGSPNAISGTVNTYAACTGTAGQTVLTTTLSASAGDQVLVHQTQHATAAGTWEIVKVASDEGATLNLTSALVNSYSTGAQAVLIPQYTGGDISGAVTGAAWDGTVGGIIAIMSNGDLTVSGSLTAPAGFRGGASVNSYRSYGYQGESPTSAGSSSRNANGMAGGGGQSAGVSGESYSWECAGGAGGAYGANGTGGGNASGSDGGFYGGYAGAAGGVENLTSILMGSAGGAGGSRQGNVVGGKGGGIILIIAKNITVTGTISVNGSNGTNGNAISAYSGGAGGGAGGAILIKCQTGSLGTTKLTATAGSGGSGNSNGGAGGNGGVGRIHIDYADSYTGTTTPTLSSAQDLTLNIPSGGFFNFF